MKNTCRKLAAALGQTLSCCADCASIRLLVCCDQPVIVEIITD